MSIVVKNLTYIYDEGMPFASKALDNISFEIKSSSEVSRIMFMAIEISSSIFVKVILSLCILILYYIFVINTIDNENFNQEVI